MSTKTQNRLALLGIIMAGIGISPIFFINEDVDAPLLAVIFISLLIGGSVLFVIAVLTTPYDYKGRAKLVDANNPLHEKDTIDTGLKEELEETIKIYNQLVSNPKINNMTNNFIEVLNQQIFIDSTCSTIFTKNYLQKTPLGTIFLKKLQLPSDVYISLSDIYDTQAFSTFNELLCKEAQIESSKIQLLSYLLLQNSVIDKYSTLWQEEYHDGKFGEESINEYVHRCLDSNIIDSLDDYGFTLLTYYILKQKNNIYNTFPFEIKNIQTTINEFKEKRQNELLRKQILSENSTEITIRTQFRPSINDIDVMTGVEFEKFVCVLFQRMGYIAYVTQTSRDQGLDVIAEKNGKRIGIQAKCYANIVSNSAVQEAVAGKNYYNCERVIVVTNNFFTKSAIDLAKANNVVLWNRDILKEKIIELF